MGRDVNVPPQPVGVGLCCQLGSTVTTRPMTTKGRSTPETPPTVTTRPDGRAAWLKVTVVRLTPRVNAPSGPESPVVDQCAVESAAPFSEVMRLPAESRPV